MNCSGAIAPSLEFNEETLYIVVCYSLVFLFALVGNSIMFLILFRNQCQKRRRVHSLLLHMTVAHLLVTLIYMPKEIIHNITVGWWGGDLLCRICKFFDVFGVALSAGILMCLSLDRFYSILFPLYVINAKRSVTRMLTVAWCVSILTSLPQIYIFRTAQHPCFDWYTQCVSADVIGQISPKVTFWFSVLNILQVYFLPLIVILICYGSILISISLKTRNTSFSPSKSAATKATKRSSQQRCASSALSTSAFLSQHRVKGSPELPSSKLIYISSPPTNSRLNQTQAKNYSTNFPSIPKSNSISVSGIVTSNSDSSLRRTGGEDSFQRAKNRTLKMTVVLVLAFLLCWTPYTVAMFIHFLSASQRIIPPLVRKFLYAFAVFNSAISPYLYGYFSFNIWEELRLLLYCCSTPSCLAKCGCRKLAKNSAESNSNRLHAIRVRTTGGELSSSTFLPPTTTVSGGSFRGLTQHQRQQQQEKQQNLPKTTNNNNVNSSGECLPNNIHANSNNSCTPMPQHRKLEKGLSKAFSLDSTTTSGYRDDLIKFALYNEMTMAELKEPHSNEKTEKLPAASIRRRVNKSANDRPSSIGGESSDKIPSNSTTSEILPSNGNLITDWRSLPSTALSDASYSNCKKNVSWVGAYRSINDEKAGGYVNDGDNEDESKQPLLCKYRTTSDGSGGSNNAER